MHLPRDVFSFYKFSAGKRLHPFIHTQTLTHTFSLSHIHKHTHTCTHRSRRSSDIRFKKMFRNERVNVHTHTSDKGFLCVAATLPFLSFQLHPYLGRRGRTHALSPCACILNLLTGQWIYVRLSKLDICFRYARQGDDLANISC